MRKKVCLIVGAGQGLGRALAQKFATEGYHLNLVSRTLSGSQIALKAAHSAFPGGDHRHVTADATKPEELEKTLAEAVASHGTPEIFIHNPRGGYQLRDPLQISYAEMNDTLNLEVVGALASAKAIIPEMLDNKKGTIIFSSATAAFRGSATNPLYSIGKFGLRGLSQSLAKAYSAKGLHIAHVRLDCTLDVPDIRDWMGDTFKIKETSNVDDVAQSYWWLHQQPRSAWSNELELRPYSENWTF
ncbi:MAG: SDR family NAD(P)-dependent oxidoreductase [Proteobacteria bacterium]|nr:SDR family NAD(P)-dependent oxidoreductase [Pseudomonadota bacterium]